MKLFEQIYHIGQLMEESRIMAKYFDINDKSKIEAVIRRAKSLLVPLIMTCNKAKTRMRNEKRSEGYIQSIMRGVGVTPENRYVRYRDTEIDNCRHFEIGNYSKTWEFLKNNPDYYDSLLQKLLKLININNYVATVNWMGNLEYEFENDELYVFYDEESNIFMKFGFRPDTKRLVIESIHTNETTEINVDYADAIDATDEAKEFYLKTLGHDVEKYTYNECNLDFKYVSGRHTSVSKIELDMDVYNGDTKLDEPGIWRNKDEILDIIENFKYYYSSNTKFWVNAVKCNEEGRITICFEFIRKDRYGGTKGELNDRICSRIQFPPKPVK